MFSSSACRLAGTHLLRAAFRLRVGSDIARGGQLVCGVTAAAVPRRAAKPSIGIPTRLIPPKSRAAKALGCHRWNRPSRVETWDTSRRNCLDIICSVAAAASREAPPSTTVLTIAHISNVQTMTSDNTTLLQNAVSQTRHAIRHCYTHAH